MLQKNLAFYSQSPWDSTHIENVFEKCSKHLLERTAIKLDFKEALDLLLFVLALVNVRKITRIDHEKYPAHPQVTAFRKLERSSIDSNGTTLNFEELMSIGDIMGLSHDRPDQHARIFKKMLELNSQNASSQAPEMKNDNEVGNNLPPISEEKLTLLID